MLTHYHLFCPFLPKTDQVPPSGDPVPRGTVFYSPVLTPKPPSTVTGSAVYYCQDTGPSGDPNGPSGDPIGPSGDPTRPFVTLFSYQSALVDWASIITFWGYYY